MRNFDVNNGFCNGTRLIITDIKKNCLQVKIISEQNKGATFFLPRIGFIPSEEDSYIRFKRNQFPVKLAYSLTINRAQGQTIENCGIYLDAPLFSHGHLYTAMSRVRN